MPSPGRQGEPDQRTNRQTAPALEAVAQLLRRTADLTRASSLPMHHTKKAPSVCRETHCNKCSETWLSMPWKPHLRAAESHPQQPTGWPDPGAGFMEIQLDDEGRGGGPGRSRTNLRRLPKCARRSAGRIGAIDLPRADRSKRGAKSARASSKPAGGARLIIQLPACKASLKSEANPVALELRHADFRSSPTNRQGIDPRRPNAAHEEMVAVLNVPLSVSSGRVCQFRGKLRSRSTHSSRSPVHHEKRASKRSQRRLPVRSDGGGSRQDQALDIPGREKAGSHCRQRPKRIATSRSGAGHGLGQETPDPLGNPHRHPTPRHWGGHCSPPHLAS